MRAEDPPPSLMPQPMAARVVAAFTGNVERLRVSFGYRLAMLAVLLALAVLPLLYLAMIAGACWLLLWHVRNDLVWFEYVASIRMLILVVVGYLGTTIAGVISILFLIKPFFAPPSKQPPPIPLDPLAEPAVFALVHGICDVTGTPRPARVQVDCRVAASVDFRRGVAGLPGQDFVLTLGMPLVAGMNVQQLAGVLAHELGFFARGGATRLDCLVRSLQAWFERQVHHRDPWDCRLDILEESGAAKHFVGVTAKAMIWVGRLQLRWLMHLGGALGGRMSRRMELNADARAARVVGSQALTDALLRLALLAQAQHKVTQQVHALLQTGALPDNVPLRISGHERGMTGAERERARRQVLAEDTAWWHTRPALSQRREALADMHAPGVFHLDDPAQALFTDFATLCRMVSVHWYETGMGLDLNRFEMVDMEATLETHVKKPQAREFHEEAVRAVFGWPPPPHRLIPLPDAVPDHATQLELVEAWKDGYEAACAQEQHLRNAALNQTTGCHLAQLGFAQEALQELGMDLSGPEAALTSQMQAVQAYQAFSGQMQVFEQAAWGRIAAALGTHHQQPGTPEDWRQRVGLLVEAQRALAAAVQCLACAAVDVEVVAFAVNHRRYHPAGGDLRPLLREHDERVHQTLLRTVEALATAADPNAEKPQRLSETIKLADLSDSGAYYALACHPPLLRALDEAVALVTGELCALTLAAERERISAAAMQMRALAQGP